MNESRGNWYLLTGLLLGLALGLLYSWVISPVKYTGTTPASLTGTFKDEYRRVIAMAYQADHDLGRARQRLELLKEENAVQVLAAQAQRMLASDQPSQEARALAILAADLGKPQEALVPANPTAVAGQDQTPTPEPSPFATLEVGQAISTPTVPLPTVTPTVTVTPTITRTPQPTFTLRPAATLTPTLSAPFKLVSKHSVCDNTVRPGILEVQVNDGNGKPLPGVRIQVTWQDGESVFYTGLIPEVNPGYADFSMTAGVTYTLKVGEVGETVKDLALPDCNGSWQTVFSTSTENH